MALMEVQFFSEVLGMCCEANVILPQREQGIGVSASTPAGVDGYPVLWLLHGASDDHTIWLRRTSIERYAAPLGLAVVMPAAHLSRYCNMVHGPRYFDFFAEELPAIMREFFPLSSRREENHVAGLSMGGYGALKLGMSRPEQYATVGCFSSGNLIYHNNVLSQKRPSGRPGMMESIYGTDSLQELIGNPDFDVFAAAEQSLTNNLSLPSLYHVCGLEDFLLDNARLSRDWFQTHRQLNYTYLEDTGAHTWEFWDKWIQEYLKWALGDKNGAKADI